VGEMNGTFKTVACSRGLVVRVAPRWLVDDAPLSARHPKDGSTAYVEQG
jgi:hypothetical protein